MSQPPTPPSVTLSWRTVPLLDIERSGADLPIAGLAPHGDSAASVVGVPAIVERDHLPSLLPQAFTFRILTDAEQVHLTVGIGNNWRCPPRQGDTDSRRCLAQAAHDEHHPPVSRTNAARRSTNACGCSSSG